MVYIFVILAVGLSLVAWKSTERSTRYWCLAWAILNALAATKAIVTDDPWAFRLKPNDWADSLDEYGYRRR